MVSLRPAAALLALVLAAAAARPGVRGDAHAVVRRFVSELELRTDAFELVGSDQRVPLQAREQAEELEVVDVADDADDPLARFTREYRTVASSVRIGDEARDRPARTTSAVLEGRVVVFERADDGGWTRSCDDEDVRPVQLQRLRADLGLAAFLPPDDAADGVAHELDVALLARLFSPAVERYRRPRVSAAPARPASLDLAPAAMVEPLGALLEDAEGTLTVTPRARADDDELPRNATLEFRLEATFDGSAGLLRGGGEAEDELEIVVSGTGSVAWDPDEGRIAVACDGEVRIDERFRVPVAADGRAGEVTGFLAATGTLALEAEERPE